MVRISNPQDIQDPTLRELAYQAAWIAMVTEAGGDLEDLLEDVSEEERTLPHKAAPWPWETDSMAVALHLTQNAREQAERDLARQLAGWLGADPERRAVSRLAVLDSWRDHSGQWDEETPGWVRSLGTIMERVQTPSDTPDQSTEVSAKRYRALSVTRGVEVFVEIVDEVTRQGLLVPFPEILTLGADINLELARICEVLGARMDQGTLPVWERITSTWGPHGEGKAEHN